MILTIALIAALVWIFLLILAVALSSMASRSPASSDIVYPRV